VNVIVAVPQSSFAEGVLKTGTAGQLMVVLEGTLVITGAVLSTILNMAVRVLLMPQ
jgi:hypothetical protein